MNLKKVIVDSEKEYFNLNGEHPEYLIISAAEAGELAYEVAIDKGIPSEEAYVYDLTKWRNMLICIVYNKKFEGFVLK